MRSDVTPTEDRGFRLGEVNDYGISLIEADKEEDFHQLFSNRICAPKLTELKIEYDLSNIVLRMAQKVCIFERQTTNHKINSIWLYRYIYRCWRNPSIYPRARVVNKDPDNEGSIREIRRYMAQLEGRAETCRTLEGRL